MGEIDEDFLGPATRGSANLDERAPESSFRCAIRKPGGSSALSPWPTAKRPIRARRSWQATKRCCSRVWRMQSSSGKMICARAKRMAGMADSAVECDVPQQAGQRRPNGWSGSLHWPRDGTCGRGGRGRWRRKRAARLANRRTCRPRWSTNSPNLQGLDGALLQQRPRAKTPAVAAAAEEHYAPLGPSDDCANSACVCGGVIGRKRSTNADRVLGDR